MKKLAVAVSLGCISMWSASANASEPFSTCPTKAFLVQGATAIAYGVNIVSGSSAVLSSDMGTTGKINGTGFSVHDNYLYGYGYEAKDLVRMGNDFQAVPMGVTGLPNTSFYVGDAAVTENAYYFYRKGSSYGLYRVSLDENDSDYLQASRVIDGSALNLNIFDMAFHPDSGEAYAVDANGNLHKIDVVTGAATRLANLGVSGTFGAAYFDVEGNLYISRNSDGYIYRIKVDALDSMSIDEAVQLFAVGPLSGNNDGARCATAPIIDDSIDIDFGDAPASYGSSLNENGARHEMGDLHLGPTVTSEYAARLEDTGDDGVAFLTNIQAASDADLQSLMSVNVSKDGYLHGWVDWNQNGKFEDAEQVFDGKYVTEGDNTLLLNVKAGATPGTTWSRFRVSTSETLAPTGGDINGEVEDYEISIGDAQYTTVCYPSATGFVTLAYEDIWPSKGDYDFNDVVVQYRACQDKFEGQVMRYWVKGNLTAVGAEYHNGFAVRLEGVAASNVNTALISHRIGNDLTPESPLESGRQEAILTVLPDTRELFAREEGCRFFRTENGCFNQDVIPFSLYVPLVSGVDEVEAPTGVLDPFIFAVDGYGHGAHVSSNNERGWEVHLKHQAPTEAFDMNTLGTVDDASVPAQSEYYMTDNGLPFAIQVSETWQAPREEVDITEAYSEFADFAESSGATNRSWFTNPISNKVIPKQ